ncbi:MAG: 50S ribosomal protein L9 [Planctomycetota bacterium]
MKLLLRKDISNLGLCGDIVDVSSGHARNYLLPHHLALKPTKANLKTIEADKKAAAADRERRHAFLLSMRDRLSGVEVTISAACNPEGHLYGSVGPREISRALMEEGHSVHPDQIKMSTNIKEVGAIEVPIVLSEDVSAEIKLWVVAEKAAGDLEENADAEVGPDEETANVAGDDAIVGIRPDGADDAGDRED